MPAPQSRRVRKRIRQLIDESPEIERGRVGFKFIDLATGRTIAELNSNSFFTPASNTKLYTTALALSLLGPTYRFTTQLRTNGTWAPGRTTIPDLELVGGGDPDLSGRVLPYQKDAREGDPLAALEEMADKLVASGIREIDGDITGVSTRYPGDRYQDGWTIDDSVYDYGAPVSALTLDDNTIAVKLQPSEPGELAAVEVSPRVDYFTILNQVTTDSSAEAHVHALRSPGSKELVLWGTIGKSASEWEGDFAVDDPALFAAVALMEVLEDRGITVRGQARSRYVNLNEVPNPLEGANPPMPPGSVLAVHESAPLWQIIQVTSKVSQNLHAEMLLREAALAARGIGTLDAGVSAREAFLKQIGITPEGSGVTLDDGSGLARQDLTTPDSTVALLRYMLQPPNRDLWLQFLPIGGVDGTLEHRFRGIEEASRVHAKTGSIAHVNALSGYIEGRDGQPWIAFSIMVNGTTCPAKQVREFMDRLCAIFFDQE